MGRRGGEWVKYVFAFLLGIIPGFGFHKAMYCFEEYGKAEGIAMIVMTILLELMVVLIAYKMMGA